MFEQAIKVLKSKEIPKEKLLSYAKPAENSTL